MEKKVSTQRRLFGYLSLQLGGTLVSRVLGFARELVTATYFGAGPRADAFFAALTIPTLFRDVLGEDVVERSFMPGVRESLAKGDTERAWRLVSVSLNWMLVAMALVMAFVYVAAPWLVTLVAEGLDDPSKGADVFAMTVSLTRVLTPFIMFIALASFVGGLLYYAFDRHLVFSFAPAMLSVGVILGVVFLYDFHGLGIYSLAIGFVAGAALHFLVQLPSLFRQTRAAAGARYSFSLRPPAKYTKRMIGETGYVTLQSVLTKTTEVFDRRVASFLADAGSISSLWYAARLVQLPLAIFAIAISRAITPYLSEQLGKGDLAEFRKALLMGYRYNLLLILPTIGFLIVLATPFVRIVFERGSFDAGSTAMTAKALWCYAPGLLGMSLYRLGSTVCSALGKNRVPTITAAFGGALNIVLNYVLSATPLRHGGLALATSIAFTVNAAALFVWLHVYLGKEDLGFSWRDLLAPAVRVGLNVVLAVAAAWAVDVVTPTSTAAASFLTKAMAFSLPLVAGAVVYGVASLLNPIDEVQPVIRRLKRLRGR